MTKAGAARGISLSLAALVHDLGRPARFVNMLRVLKVTSPMSVGTWIVSAYAPPRAGRLPVLTGLPHAGAAATVTAGVIGPAVAAYTSVLIADTATPAWHGAYRELPYLFRRLGRHRGRRARPARGPAGPGARPRPGWPWPEPPRSSPPNCCLTGAWARRPSHTGPGDREP